MVLSAAKNAAGVAPTDTTDSNRTKMAAAAFWARVGLVALLFVVWPMRHTIALRNGLLGLLLIDVFFTAAWKQARTVFFRGSLRWVSIFCGLFTVWILLVAAFISPFAHWSFQEILGQWVTALGALVIGAGCALQGKQSDVERIIHVILAVLLLHIAIVDGQGAWLAIRHHAWPDMARLGGITAGPGKASYLTNFLLSGLVAEMTLRMETRRHLPIGRTTLAVALVLCVISINLEAMRNELFDVAVFFGFALWMGYRTNWKAMPKIGRGALLGGLMLVVILAALNLRSDPRWKTLWATVPIALQTTQHLAWLNAHRYPFPRLPNGHTVSPSNYLRIAWVKEGLETIFRHPLGVGYGRSAFGHAMRARFGAQSAVIGLNNSLLTIAIGAGIPGAILWLAWFVALTRAMVVRIRSDKGAFAARFLLLIVLSFGIRMALDNDMQNYTLEQFCFFVGLLAPLAIGNHGQIPKPLTTDAGPGR